MRRRLIACLAALMAAGALLQAQGADTFYTALYVEVRPAAVRDGAALVSQYAAASRKDDGNRRVDALREVGRPDRFLVVAEWNNESAFAAHQKAAHTLAFRATLKEIQRAPYDQRTHRGLTADPMPAAAGANTLYVATHVDVPGAMREQGEALLKRMVEPSRADAGRVRYDVYQQTDRPNHFTVFAAWTGRPAFDASSNTPHWLQYRESLGPMLGALFDERLYEALRP